MMRRWRSIRRYMSAVRPVPRWHIYFATFCYAFGLVVLVSAL